MRSRLSLVESTGIIVGAGVGGGVMAVPYLASQAGIWSFVSIVAVATLLNICLNLLLADVLLRDGRDLQIIELMREYVFRGRVGSGVAWILFVVLGLSFVASLTAYATGAGDVLAGITGLAPRWSRLIIYGVCAAVVFLGLKGVGVSEALGLVLLIVFAAVILVVSLGTRGSAMQMHGTSPSLRGSLALYGMVMYSLNAAFAVPQAVKGVQRVRSKAIASVILGTTLNAALIVLVTVVALAVSRPVTEVAVIGISAAAGPVAGAAGSLFVLFAMMSTYWSVSLALADIVSQRVGSGPRLSWLLASAPTLVLIVFGFLGFVEYMQIAGGIVALVVVFVTAPMFVRAANEKPIDHPAFAVQGNMRTIVLSVFMAGMALMAVGSFLGL